MTNRFDDTPAGAPDSHTVGGVADELTRQTRLAEIEGSRGDVPGAVSWPSVSSPAQVPAAPPPVGLNWTRVAQETGVDVRILEHDGSIVLAGEYVPAPGYVIDPSSFLARSARVGARVLYHSYFVGELTASEFGLNLAVDPDSGSVPNAVVRAAAAPVIGLFSDERDAERARRQILEGSVGYGVSKEAGPLGTELRVARTEHAGRVATVIASHHGAVISVGGASL